MKSTFYSLLDVALRKTVKSGWVYAAHFLLLYVPFLPEYEIFPGRKIISCVRPLVQCVQRIGAECCVGGSRTEPGTAALQSRSLITDCDFFYYESSERRSSIINCCKLITSILADTPCLSPSETSKLNTAVSPVVKQCRSLEYREVNKRYKPP